jgi:hypothetical protein
MSNFPSFNVPFKNLPRGLVFGGILVTALLAFEIFNYSTTDFALTDLLGSELKFAGVRWATILSIAFCGIDFAGIARLFTPEQGRDEPAEVWYLFGAWLLAATMNASLTWWGISIAVMNHAVAGSSLVSQSTMTRAIPVFVAIMVWLIRVLIIGTFSMSGDRIFSMDARPARRPSSQAARAPAALRPEASPARPRLQSFFQALLPDDEDEPDESAPVSSESQRSEPSYHPIGMAARNRETHGKLHR